MDSRLPGGALPLGALHEIAGGGNGAIDGAAAALFAAGDRGNARLAIRLSFSQVARLSSASRSNWWRI